MNRLGHGGAFLSLVERDRNGREMAVKSPSVLSCLVVLSVLLASMVGCSKNEKAPPLEEETAPETSVQAAESEAPAVVPAPDMEKFLAKVVSMRQVAAGQGIREFFDFQQEMLHNPRIDMKIYFEVDVKEKFREGSRMEEDDQSGLS